MLGMRFWSVCLAFCFAPLADAQTAPSLRGRSLSAAGQSRIASLAVQLYGSGGEDVAMTILKKIGVVQRDGVRNSRAHDWYRDEVVYMLYVDRFGVPHGKRESTFHDLPATLDYLVSLGVTCVYLLPFMDSPMGDAGFDVRDMRSVRTDLGAMEGFDTFAEAAKARGLKIKADLILNHLSDEHAWFQAALKGDKEKLDYFVHRDTLPHFVRYHDEQRGVVVNYTEDSGAVSSRRLMFPGATETHWREVQIDGRSSYIYHSFYPFQVDVNWRNPRVLLEFLDILTFWTNKGVDILRMDAIPFVMKDAGTDGENRPDTIRLVKLLSAYLQATAPDVVIQVEACMWPSQIVPYFGEEGAVETFGREQALVRTDAAQIAYDFPLMPAMWATLVTGDSHHFWKALETLPTTPQSAAWALFLRVHDELTLEMVDLDTRALIFKELEPHGQQFREGLGISGRMGNFLGNDPRRIVQAFRLLLTLPGLPIIYFGDEIGAQNDFEFAKYYETKRGALQLKQGSVEAGKSFYDSRDIHRGPITLQQLQAALSGSDERSHSLMGNVSTAVHLRRATPPFRRGALSPLKCDTHGAFAYMLTSGSEWSAVVHNLAAEAQYVVLPLGEAAAEPLRIRKGMVLQDAFERKPLAVEWSEAGASLLLGPYQSVALLS